MMKTRTSDEQGHCIADWYASSTDTVPIMTADLVGTICGDGGATLVSIVTRQGMGGEGNEQQFIEAMYGIWGVPVETEGPGVQQFLLAARQ